MAQQSGIAWSWRNVAHGVVLSAPAVIATMVSPEHGIPLAVGVLPAAALGLRSSRRQRLMVVVVGLVAAGALFLGSAVAPWPVAAVITVFALCVVVAVAVADPARRLAPLVLMLGLPLFGAGLSEGSWSTGLAAGALIVAGSAYGCLVSLPWPVSPPPTAAEPRPAPRRTVMAVYGVQIGLAGAAAAALGFALGVDHPGWACTAALLVSRPDRRQLDARAGGRAISVTAGAAVACAIALTTRRVLSSR